MSEIDDAIAGLGHGGVLLALLAALLIGLRHATDPDHLTAVSSLVLSDEPGEARRASKLGLYWDLPPAIARVAEFAVGAV